MIIGNKSLIKIKNDSVKSTKNIFYPSSNLLLPFTNYFLNIYTILLATVFLKANINNITYWYKLNTLKERVVHAVANNRK